MAGRSSFSSSSSFSYGWKYDVFLNFRGEDTRRGFTGNLYKALRDKGIHTFCDDGELQRGEEITSSLLNAIEESRIAIAIFSRNYASSTFCLEELVHIIHCFKEKGRLLLPIFYDVDPSEVRNQRRSYGEAMARHVERFKYDKEMLEDNMERLKKWKMALKQAANLCGEDFQLRNEYEYDFIRRIVKVVSNKINRAPLHVADYPVGLDYRVLEVNSLLDVGSDDVVHMVGIHGISGIGKTTLARAVYNSIADSFQCSCFLGSVRENSMKQGLVHLQEMLLSKIVGEKDIKLGDVCEGISIIKHRLHRKKVLLILDDVDKLEQLQSMVGVPDWFGPGSRVIITTWDKHLLERHGVERTYELDGLNMREAIELLNWKAFRTNKVDPSYVDILNRVVTYTSRLPFALEVIGSKLFGKSVEDWESALVNEPFCHAPTKVDLYSDSTTSRLATDRVSKRTQFIEYPSTKENWEDDLQTPRKGSKTTKSRSKRKSVGLTSSKSKSLEWYTLENSEEEPTIAPKSKEKTIGESTMKSGQVKHTAVKRGREVLNVDTSDSSQHHIEEQLASKVARSSSVNKGIENTMDLEQEPFSLHPSKDNSPVTSRRSRTPSPSPSPQRGSILSQGVQTPLLEEISPAPNAHFEGHFELKVQPINFDLPEKETSIGAARDTPFEDTEVVVQESTSHQPEQDQPEAEVDQPVIAKTLAGPPETVEVVDDNSGVDKDTGSLDEDDDEDDPLKLIKDILFGKTSMSSKSLRLNEHSEVEVQSISTTQLLKELAALLNLGLDQLMASEDNKHKMTTLLEQVGQHSQLLNLDVRQAVQKLSDLFKDLMANFFDFKQAITNHQQHLDTRAKLMNIVTKAKRRRSKLNTTLSTTQQRISQNEEKIVELEAQLQELKKQQEDLQAKVSKLTTQEQQLKNDYSKWVVESKNVMTTIQTSMPAFKKASAKRKKAEETLESIQFFFNHL